MSAPPPPERTRAVIIGIEDYSGLGKNYHLPGSLVDAARMRELLRDHFKVPEKRITTFLAPLDEAQLAAQGARHFSRDAIDKFFEHEIAKDVAGGTLIVVWSGHGVYSPHDGSLDLLAADATQGQLRSIGFDALSRMLIGAPFAQFTHQVLVISACRSAIGASVPNSLNLSINPPDPLRAVHQCQLYACAEGQSAQQAAADGSRLVRALRAALEREPAGRWPDFIDVFAHVQAEVVADSKGRQRPAVFATGWDRGRLAGAAAAAPLLSDSIEAIGWPLQRCRLHALRCFEPHSPWPEAEALASVAGLIRHLDNLPRNDGVAPLAEFVARVHAMLDAADAEARAALEAWLELNTTAGERTSIAERLAMPLGHVLQLWLDGEPGPLMMKAALFDADNRLLAEAWDKEVGIEVEDGDVAAAVAAWIERANAACGGDATPLAVELCVPQPRLAQDLDKLTLAVDGRAVALNADYAALLRNTDRLKAPSSCLLLRQTALAILDRAARAKALIRWAEEKSGRNELLIGLFGRVADAPVWIGLPAPATAPELHRNQLQICLNGPAPALFWLRLDAPAVERPEIETQLAGLLRFSGADLPHRLLEWRREQIGCRSEEVALLLDDPRRMPPWSAKFGAS